MFLPCIAYIEPQALQDERGASFTAYSRLSLSAFEKYFSVYCNWGKESVFSHEAPKPEEGKPYNAQSYSY
jgi:hypothetical protein